MQDPEDAWFVYLVRCSDNTFYCGIAKDVERRVKEHNGKRGARYTRTRQPVELLKAWPCESHSQALHKERWIKSLKRKQKEALLEQEKL